MPQFEKHLFFLFCMANCITVLAADSTCLTQNSSIEITQCEGERLSLAEEQLDLWYQEALKKLPETSDWDKRKTQAQLKKAENAWQIYRDENCNYVGGLQGGNNIWVTIFSTECLIKETENRIEFFKKFPTYG